MVSSQQQPREYYSASVSHQKTDQLQSRNSEFIKPIVALGEQNGRKVNFQGRLGIIFNEYHAKFHVVNYVSYISLHVLSMAFFDCGCKSKGSFHPMPSTIALTDLALTSVAEHICHDFLPGFGILIWPWMCRGALCHRRCRRKGWWWRRRGWRRWLLWFGPSRFS